MKVKQCDLKYIGTNFSHYPMDGKPEIAFAGKSNVGKSTLINAILGRKALARTSSQPGKTRTINFYGVNDMMYVVDLPGYGYAKVPKSEVAKWGQMMEEYLTRREELRAIILLIDIRHEQNKLLRGEHDFAEDIIACAMNISKRYNGSTRRADTLEHITTTIFDSMKKVHGMGQRERLYLRLAAILHDCGKYISMINIGEASYDIIMATEMIGLSHMEREIVANVVRFNHSNFVYYGQAQDRPQGLDKESYLTVAKLTAILRLANSLDRSHKQKMKGVKATLQDNELILKIDSQEDITLERGFFQTNTEFFKEVYSITPVIRQKKKF